MRMIISPLDVDKELTQAIASRLRDVLPWEFVITPRCAPDTQGRGTVPVEQIFAVLHANDHLNDITIGVTSLDLTAPGFDHVFGYAAPERRCAAVSLYRLANRRNDGCLLAERASKEVLHETGHVLGLGHCNDPRCVMTYSQTLQDTDIKPCKYCARCLRELSRMPGTTAEEM